MISAEIRKVQVTGKSTFVVSLPKKWAVSAGITSGSLVHMHPQEDGSLLLTSNGGFAGPGYKDLKHRWKGRRAVDKRYNSHLRRRVSCNRA